MKTSKKIRATFSDDVVEIILPKGWGDISSEELADVYDIMACYEDSGDDVRFFLFCYFAGISIAHLDKADGKYNCAVPAYRGDELVHVVLRLTPSLLAEILEELNWITSPGDMPVRVAAIGGANAVDAHFHGVTFKTYLMVENYYQGYLQSKNPLAIAKIERLLYPGADVDDNPDLPRILNILNWLVQVKGVFSQHFRNFLKPAAVADGEDAPNMLEIMNNQIRALTGGDVTKEDIIHEIDCWRALTELDYKAKEAEEFKRIQQKTKK